jgi:phenylacetate-CoA ligase
MTLFCELADAARLSDPDGLSALLVATLRDVTQLRANVELMALGSLPNDGKVISDERQYT